MTEFVAGASPMLLLDNWKPVVGSEGRYEVSVTGKVFSLIRNRELSPYVSKQNGYVYISLNVNGKRKGHRLHILVATAFYGPCPEGMEINHKDTCIANPRLSNLEFCTHLDYSGPRKSDHSVSYPGG